MKNKTRIEINIKALKNNLKEINSHATNKIVQGVVKANAYGHGDIEIARALEGIGVNTVGVARVEEGVRLREAGINADILVLGGAEKSEFETLFNYSLKPVIYNKEIAKKLNSYLSFRKKTMPVHVKFDTGMHRLGIMYEKRYNFYTLIKELKNLEIEGIMTHFLAAGSVENPWNNIQIEKFTNLINEWKKEFKKLPKFIHAENSASFFNFNIKNTNMARLGIALYGYGMKNLTPVLSLYSIVKDIKKLKKDETVSYGGWYKAERDMTVAVIPVGYGDGFMRSNRKGEVLINGNRAKIVGIICMDYFMVDITDIKEVNIGDTVTIIGKDLNAEYWSKISNTIVYEILTIINPRIRRVYED